MLLPALARAKSSALRTSCSSNLKQLVLAAAQYVSDSKGNSLPLYSTGGTLYGNTLWMGELLDYDAKVNKVRLCPSASKTNSVAGSQPGACDTYWKWDPGVAGQPALLGSYCFNGWVYSGDSSQIAQFRTDVGNAVRYVFGKESSVQKPSLTPIIADSVWVDFWPMETDGPNRNLYLAGGTANPPELERCVTPRHGWKDPGAAPRSWNPARTLPGGIDIGLMDGHVEGPPLEKLWSYSWHLNWKTPSKRPVTAGP